MEKENGEVGGVKGIEPSIFEATSRPRIASEFYAVFL